MLTVEQNEELTKVGPGTPMGELLRRYWYPIAFEQDFDEVPTKTVRLLGENWTLFKTPKGGRYGIVAEACPHRRASLTYGVVHEDGIRCGYHGWKWDFDGTCLEQPAEADNQNFRDRVRQKAGKAEAMGGMIWVYVGPQPAPELPRFDVFVMDGVKDCGYTTLPCNWLQIMENSVDPHHVEWLHGYYFEFLGQTTGFDAPKAFQKKHIRTGFDEMEWGILKRRVLEGSSEENDDWEIGHPLVFPYFMRVGGAGIDQMQIRVPIDDTTTWKLFYSNHAPQGGVWEPRARPVFYEYLWRDEQGRFITDYIEGQDIMAWVSQGPVTDRTQEHLGRSDAGVALLRKMFKENIKRVQDGQDPLGTVREKHDRIDLPCEKDKFGAEREFAEAWITGGSMRYSPIRQELLDLHVSAWANREKAGAGAELADDAARADEARAVRGAELPPDPHRLPPPDAWFAKDAVRHLLDRPKFCPMCGAPLEADGITTEYWSADSRHFMTWCGGCHWFGEVVRFRMVTITEAEH